MKREVCPNCGGTLSAESIGWRCKNCRGFISLQDGKFYEYVEKPFMPPQTNADRIRAMSDEGLCDFLGQYKFCDICLEGCESCTYNGDCDKRLLDWLKQPAEEGIK